MADQIPLGQPILVGHYSEGRDRRFRARLGRMMERSYAKQQEAGRLQERAEAAARNRAIFSDDPLATMKLEEKIAHLEARQAAMKRINAVSRSLKLSKAQPDLRERMLQGVAAGRWSEAEVRAVVEASTYTYDQRVAFPGYALTNNQANIRRLKARVQGLVRQEETPERSPEEHGGVRLIDNKENNRVQVVFPGKPDAAVRQLLKGAGFHWSPSEGGWPMTLAQIRGMFVVGQVWEAENTYVPRMSGRRTVREVTTGGVCWETAAVARAWVEWPRQREVVEARPGYLKCVLRGRLPCTLTVVLCETSEATAGNAAPTPSSFSLD